MKLYTAVLKEIQEKKKFSAFDITKALRKKVNDDDIYVDDADEITLDGGEIVYEVPHFSVKEIVQEIFDEQALPLKRNQGPGYFIYELSTPVNSITASILAINPNANKPNPVIRNPVQVNTATSVTPLNSLAACFAAKPKDYKTAVQKASANLAQVLSLKDKVKICVENKKKNNKKLTLWDIQKSLKEKGVTVGTIANLCATLGYTIVRNDSWYKSEVR